MKNYFGTKAFVKIIIASTLLLGLGTVNAKVYTLWGKQIPGWGHSKNARTEGNKITLNTPAKIISVKGNATGVHGFCFWSQTLTVNRAILCGGTDRAHSVIGQILPPDTYTIFPKVGKYVKVRLQTVKYQKCPITTTKKQNKVLWGKQIAGWGHSKNAKVEGNRLTFTTPVKILKIQGNATGVKGFCLWANRHSILCGGTDSAHSIVGQILQPGTYTVLPRAGTYVRIWF